MADRLGHAYRHGPDADCVTGLEHGVPKAETLATRYYIRIEPTDTTTFSFPAAQDKAEWKPNGLCINAELTDRVTESSAAPTTSTST